MIKETLKILIYGFALGTACYYFTFWGLLKFVIFLVVFFILIGIIGKLIINNKTKKLKSYLSKNQVTLTPFEQWEILLSAKFEYELNTLNRKFDNLKPFIDKLPEPFCHYVPDFFRYQFLKESFTLNFQDVVDYYEIEANVAADFCFNNSHVQDGFWITAYKDGNYEAGVRERGFFYETYTFKTKREFAIFYANRFVSWHLNRIGNNVELGTLQALDENAENRYERTIVNISNIGQNFDLTLFRYGRILGNDKAILLFYNNTEDAVFEEYFNPYECSESDEKRLHAIQSSLYFVDLKTGKTLSSAIDATYYEVFLKPFPIIILSNEADFYKNKENQNVVNGSFKAIIDFYGNFVFDYSHQLIDISAFDNNGFASAKTIRSNIEKEIKIHISGLITNNT